MGFISIHQVLAELCSWFQRAIEEEKWAAYMIYLYNHVELTENKRGEIQEMIL